MMGLISKLPTGQRIQYELRRFNYFFFSCGDQFQRLAHTVHIHHGESPQCTTLPVPQTDNGLTGCVLFPYEHPSERVCIRHGFR
jgi:hypothetical protein